MLEKFKYHLFSLLAQLFTIIFDYLFT